MNIREKFATAFCRLSDYQQQLFLAQLIMRWNVFARAFYDSGDALVKLRHFDEAQNRAGSQLLELILGSDERYPDDVFANILIDQCEIIEDDSNKVLEWPRF